MTNERAGEGPPGVGTDRRFVAMIAGLVLAMVVVALGANAFAAASVRAEEPFPCTPYAGVDRNGPADPDLAGRLDIRVALVTGEDPVVRQGPEQRPRLVDAVTFSWPRGPWKVVPDCIFVYFSLDHPAASSGPIGRIAGDALSYTFEPGTVDLMDGKPKEVCYRLVPVSAKGYGDASEACVFVTNPKVRFIPHVGGPGPQSAPLPPDAGSGIGADGGRLVWVAAVVVAVAGVAVAGVVSFGPWAMRRAVGRVWRR